MGTGDLLKAFIGHRPFPVCLVAHNGNMYDFPLLQAEVVKTGSDLGSNVVCVDSYHGIKEVLEKNMDSPLTKDAQPAGIKCL